MTEYDTGERNTGPSYRRQRRSRQSGQSGQSGQIGQKRKIRAPSQRSITDPEIIRSITKSKFLLNLFKLLK